MSLCHGSVWPHRPGRAPPGGLSLPNKTGLQISLSSTSSNRSLTSFSLRLLGPGNGDGTFRSWIPYKVKWVPRDVIDLCLPSSDAEENGSLQSSAANPGGSLRDAWPYLHLHPLPLPLRLRPGSQVRVSTGYKMLGSQPENLNDILKGPVAWAQK